MSYNKAIKKSSWYFTFFQRQTLNFDQQIMDSMDFTGEHFAARFFCIICGRSLLPNFHRMCA